MADTLEGPARDIIAGKNYAVLSIPRKDGTVQSVVVWADVEDDGTISVNSSEGRAWPKNLRRAKTATVTAFAGDSPWEWVSATGSLASDTHEGADEHIDKLAKKYLDADAYPFRQEGEERVKFTLKPERVTYNNQG
jgi:PPOX class probable F420-dependent enzyme